jgi:hypothetical protein
MEVEGHPLGRSMDAWQWLALSDITILTTAVHRRRKYLT